MKNLEDWDYLEVRDLPESVKELVDVIGFSETKIFLQTIPILGIYIPKDIQLTENTEIEVLTPESIEKLVAFYGGTTLILPKDQALTRARNRRIRLKAKTEISNFASKAKYYAKIAEQEELCLGHVRSIIYDN